MSPNQMIQQTRDWKAEQNRTPVADSINKALIDITIYNGYNETTEQEELLQFSCYEDQEGSGWRYHRCGYRFGVRPDKDREGENCWSRHTRKENEGLGGEGTWVRCDQLVEGETQ